jgi:galactose-1-phosphate uridylyltransferase
LQSVAGRVRCADTNRDYDGTLRRPGTIRLFECVLHSCLPSRHMANFGETSADEITDLARILHAVLAKIYFGLEDPDFSYSIRTAAVANAGANYYHWHLSIVPYLPPALEIENVARLLLNPVLPETAAEYLRSIAAEEAIPA